MDGSETNSADITFPDCADGTSTVIGVFGLDTEVHGYLRLIEVIQPDVATGCTDPNDQPISDNRHPFKRRRPPSED